MPRTRIYNTDEERRAAVLATMRKYANKRILCEICNKSFLQGDRSKHKKRWCQAQVGERMND